MTNRQPPDPGPLVRLHTSLWWLLLAWFGLVTVLLILEVEPTGALSAAGLIGIVIATAGRLVQLSELFRRTGKTRLLVLSLVLICLLLATGLVGIWV